MTVNVTVGKDVKYTRIPALLQDTLRLVKQSIVDQKGPKSAKMQQDRMAYTLLLLLLLVLLQIKMMMQ